MNRRTVLRVMWIELIAKSASVKLCCLNSSGLQAPGQPHHVQNLNRSWALFGCHIISPAKIFSAKNSIVIFGLLDWSRLEWLIGMTFNTLKAIFDMDHLNGPIKFLIVSNIMLGVQVDWFSPINPFVWFVTELSTHTLYSCSHVKRCTSLNLL